MMSGVLTTFEVSAIAKESRQLHGQFFKSMFSFKCKTEKDSTWVT